MNGEPNWAEGCQGRGVRPEQQCDDCQKQRAHYGYTLVDGQWVKEVSS